MERDADTERRLAEAGWLLIVVWEHDEPALAARQVARTVSVRGKRGLKGRASEGT